MSGPWVGGVRRKLNEITQKLGWVISRYPERNEKHAKFKLRKRQSKETKLSSQTLLHRRASPQPQGYKVMYFAGRKDTWKQELYHLAGAQKHMNDHSVSV